MIFSETPIKGAFVIELERLEDERGFFARSFCQHEFENHGLNPLITQCNVSYNKKKGTLRGMHFQTEPYGEDKVVMCTQGAVYDIIVDLRSDSDTFKKWIAVELTAENRKMLYIPKSLAHGFLTLTDDTQLFYQMSQFFVPGHSSGVRWNDPAFNITLPGKIKSISEKDLSYPDFAQ